MSHKWIRKAEHRDDPDSCIYLEASWRREDIKECIVDIFKYRYQGIMANWEGRKKPYTVCIYTDRPAEAKYTRFRLLREAMQYADTILRLNSFA